MNYPVRAEGSPFDHMAIVYDSEIDLRNRVAAYLREEIYAYDRVLVAVPPSTEQVLRDLVDIDTAVIEWGLPHRANRCLGQRYSHLRGRAVTAHESGDTTLIVSEFDGNQTDERTVQYLRYEAICNESFAPFDSTMLCLGSQNQATSDTLTQFRLIHPLTLSVQGPIANPDYLAPDEFLTTYPDDFPPHPPHSPHLYHELTTLDQLAGLREHVRTWTHRHPGNPASLTPEDTDDITAAIDEIATNGLEHGRPPVQVRGWVIHHQIIVHVDDHGTTGIGPTTGYYLPNANAPTGRGLWIARHIADTLATHTTTTGTTVRITFPTT